MKQKINKIVKKTNIPLMDLERKNTKMLRHQSRVIGFEWFDV